MDKGLFQLVNGLAGHVWLVDWAMNILASDYLIPVADSLFLLGLWFSLPHPERRRQSQMGVMAALASVGLSGGIVKLLNLVYFRPRPFAQMEVSLLFYRPTDSSFPANAATVAFAIAAAVWLFNRRAGYILFLPAVLVSFARVYVGIHYPLDILGGMALGGLCSYAIFRLWPRILPLPDAILRLARHLYLA